MKHVFERDVPMLARDGVTLRANVWRPVEGKAPTLLMRLPYGKHQDAFTGDEPASLLPSVTVLLEAGYAVVHQDVRGTFASDGVFRPKLNEISDGQDTLAWLAEQDWYDGTVGTYGASYMGMTQWALAIADNPGLKAIAPSVAAANWYTGLWYSPGGALSLSLVTMWTALMSFNTEQRALERGETSDTSRMMRFGGALQDPLPLNDTLPVAGIPLVGQGQWFDDWLAHPDHDDYWAAQDWTTSITAVTVPALFSTGWYDLKIPGTAIDFVQMRTQAGSEQARDHTRMIIGPWDHENRTGRYPDRNFGPHASADLDAEHVAFYDQWLRGRPAEAPVPRVRLFVMGVDEWRDEQDWPLPGTRYTDYHLHSAGSANTSAGDGVLQIGASAAESSDVFRYDPRDPVPTTGGALLPTVPGLVGPVDQRAVDGRDDVLCYATPVLTEPVEVTGFVNLEVFVSSTAVDTDITAKLVDVFPDGRAINVCDGILRLRYRHDLSRPELMTPGEVYEVTVPMAVTSNVFLPGHRIRLDVSSSNFPHYDRNSNTGGVISSEALDDMVVAENTVHHGGARPSRLVLPLINR
ncbi:CocE/NonD family hydrolase [Cryptosporangium sp. NPDC051539]|uniref:CocE/NonD family hydrolase n=1 Tax=Cryptosporangium sp. NPDC051539 TaxID=3363962 RepID=UPI0037A21CDB